MDVGGGEHGSHLAPRDVASSRRVEKNRPSTLVESRRRGNRAECGGAVWTAAAECPRAEQEDYFPNRCLARQLRDLDRVRGGSLAEVVAHAPERERGRFGCDRSRRIRPTNTSSEAFSRSTAADTGSGPDRR